MKFKFIALICHLRVLEFENNNRLQVYKNKDFIKTFFLKKIGLNIKKNQKLGRN
jgi:Na+/H+ antiporter NhaA